MRLGIMLSCARSAGRKALEVSECLRRPVGFVFGHGAEHLKLVHPVGVLVDTIATRERTVMRELLAGKDQRSDRGRRYHDLSDIRSCAEGEAKELRVRNEHEARATYTAARY